MDEIISSNKAFTNNFFQTINFHRIEKNRLRNSLTFMMVSRIDVLQYTGECFFFNSGIFFSSLVVIVMRMNLFLFFSLLLLLMNRLLCKNKGIIFLYIAQHPHAHASVLCLFIQLNLFWTLSFSFYLQFFSRCCFIIIIILRTVGQFFFFF